jgi:hypothetical protein
MNNYETIIPLLDFTDPDKFYFIQIYKRRKDNPEMKKDMSVLANYSVSSKDEMDKYFPQIQKICDDNNARAYIRLNWRSHQKIALEMMVRLSKMIASGQYNVKNIYWSVAGEFSHPHRKTWLLDIDWVDYEGDEGKEKLEILEKSIHDLQKERDENPTFIKVPSKNGYHIIASPFNINKIGITLKHLGCRMDLHKDNPCILYCP